MKKLKKLYKKSKLERPLLRNRQLKKVIQGRGASFHQKCIIALPFMEFLDELDSNTEVAYVDLRNSPFQARLSVNPPKKIVDRFTNLKVSQLKTSFEAALSFKDKSKEEMRSAIRAICRDFNIPEKDILIRSILLRRNDALAYFTHTTKKLTTGDGKSMKIAMLGLESVSAEPAKTEEAFRMVDSLHSEDYTCKMVVETKRIAYCSKN